MKTFSVDAYYSEVTHYQANFLVEVPDQVVEQGEDAVHDFLRDYAFEDLDDFEFEDGEIVDMGLNSYREVEE